MLPGQGPHCALPVQCENSSLSPDLRLAHLVQGLDGNEWVLGLVLHKDNSAAGLEGLHHARHHLVWVGQLVIDVDHDRQVHRGSWQLDIVHRAQTRFDLREPTALGPSHQHVDHFRLHINSPDLATWHHRRSHAP